MIEDVDVGDRLDDGERNRSDTSPLVDFAAASFAVLGEFLERRDGFGEELDDDGRGDIRGDTNKDN